MPLFEFCCSSCGHVEEHIMSMSESDIDKIECFNCGGDSPKMISRSSFTLTGGGWYAAGYTKSS